MADDPFTSSTRSLMELVERSLHVPPNPKFLAEEETFRREDLLAAMDDLYKALGDAARAASRIATLTK